MTRTRRTSSCAASKSMIDMSILTATPVRSPAIKRLRLVVRGAVQGVGFRPFVYRLATQLRLTGWVTNTPQGVFLEVEGPVEKLKAFVSVLLRNFRILHRSVTSSLPILIPSDSIVSRFVKAAAKAIERHGFCRISPRVQTAWRNYSTRRIGAIAIRSQIALIAARAIPLSRRFRTTAPTLRCGDFACVQRANGNTTIPTTAAFMPSPTPARCAARTWNCGAAAARSWRLTRRRLGPLSPRSAPGRSWPSKGLGDFILSWMRETTKRSGVCGCASTARKSLSQ